MANHASAKKRIRQTRKRTATNKAARTYVRTCVKRVRAAIASGDSEAAKAALPTAIQQIDRAVSKGLFHRNAGARYIARLTRQVNSL